MPEVTRHAIDVEECRKQADRLQRDLDERRGAPKTLGRKALELTQYRTVLDPDATEDATWQALRAAARAMAEQADNAGTWCTATWLAVIARDDELIRRLCAVAPADLLAADAEYDDYMRPWVETVQAFLTRRPIGPDLFLAVMDGTDPDTVRHVSPRIMLDLIYPPIKMFYYVLRRDQEKFTAAAAAALEDHRRYWAADEEEPHGYLALAPLGVAVLARTAGMTVDVESGYFPRGFLVGPVSPV